MFTAHWVGDVLYMPSDTGFVIPRETIIPLTTVELHGRPFPAPAAYDELLALTYGPGWRTPDPSFKYETPRWLARRLNGWFGGLRTNRKHWDAFYARAGKSIQKEPSAFARWVGAEFPSDRPLVDLGAGNLRDARWFATERAFRGPRRRLQRWRPAAGPEAGETGGQGDHQPQRPPAADVPRRASEPERASRSTCTGGSCCTPWTPKAVRTC